MVNEARAVDIAVVCGEFYTGTCENVCVGGEAPGGFESAVVIFSYYPLCTFVL